jgi:hypothetical protein
MAWHCENVTERPHIGPSRAGGLVCSWIFWEAGPVVVLVDLHSKTITAWCFGTMEFDDFPNSWDDDLWLSYFFRGVVTTNQIIQKKLVLVLWLTIEVNIWLTKVDYVFWYIYIYSQTLGDV